MANTENSAIIIADLGYGDAGKGSIVDSLTRVNGAKTIVRYNGGAQAAHNVITNDGRHHTFAQFGSGTFVPGTRTHLSRFMIVHPLAMLAEERHLQSVGVNGAFTDMTIEREALITTPFQQSGNRIKEIARGDGLHGSCGMGVGETMSDWLDYGTDVLTAGDLGSRVNVVRKLGFLRDAKISQIETVLRGAPPSQAIAAELKNITDPGAIPVIADVYSHFASLVNIVGREHLGKVLNEPGTTIFEGAQGVLLDEWYGFFPYNSWSTLTFKNAESLLSESNFTGQALKLGLLRAYATRHGAGPFVTEDHELSEHLPDAHNINNPWQRQFRVGYLDFVALRYAMEACGKVDGLVITNLDRLDEIPHWPTCNEYAGLATHPDASEYFEFKHEHASAIKIPVDPTDLIKQERLTRLLMEAQPVYSDFDKDRDAYLQMISASLNLPIAITSSGPAASQKDYFYVPGFVLNPVVSARMV